MSDPIPSATADPDTIDQTHPANAEDRKAAAALSSLNTSQVGTEAVPATASGRSNAEQEALGKAMSRLEIAAGQGSTSKKSDGMKKAEVKKSVKIVAADVTFLAEQLDVHKIKATELLRAQEGDVARAMRAFVTPSF